jgi:hypothetical protein
MSDCKSFDLVKNGQVFTFEYDFKVPENVILEDAELTASVPSGLSLVGAYYFIAGKPSDTMTATVNGAVVSFGNLKEGCYVVRVKYSVTNKNAVVCPINFNSEFTYINCGAAPQIFTSYACCNSCLDILDCSDAVAIFYDNTYNVTPTGSDSTGERGFLNYPFKTIHGANTDLAVEDGDHFIINKGEYYPVIVASGSNRKDVLGGDANNVSYHIVPGTIISTSGNVTYGLFTDVDEQAVLTPVNPSFYKVEAPYTELSSGVTEDLPILIGMYHEDSEFSGTFGTLSQEYAGRSWFVQTSSQHFDLKADRFIGGSGDVVVSFSSVPGYVADGRYNNVEVDYIETRGDSSVSRGALRTQFTKTDNIQNSTFKINVGTLHQKSATSTVQGSILISDSAIGTGSVIDIDVDKIIDETPATAFGDTSGPDSDGIGSILIAGLDTVDADPLGGIEYTNIRVGNITTNKCLIYFPSISVNPGEHIENINKIINLDVSGVTTDGNCVKFTGSGTSNRKLTNTKILITGDMMSEGAKCINLSDIDLDVDSEIRFKNCRFETQSIGDPVVIIDNVIGAGADNIIFENCIFINDGVTETFEATDAIPHNIKIINCYANSLAIDANVTEQVEAVVRDTNVI